MLHFPASLLVSALAKSRMTINRLLRSGLIANVRRSKRGRWYLLGKSPEDAVAKSLKCLNGKALRNRITWRKNGKQAWKPQHLFFHVSKTALPAPEKIRLGVGLQISFSPPEKAKKILFGKTSRPTQEQQIERLAGFLPKEKEPCSSVGESQEKIRNSILERLAAPEYQAALRDSMLQERREIDATPADLPRIGITYASIVSRIKSEGGTPTLENIERAVALQLKAARESAPWLFVPPTPAESSNAWHAVARTVAQILPSSVKKKISRMFAAAYKKPKATIVESPAVFSWFDRIDRPFI